MARRATIFQGEEESGERLLKIAGFFEITRPNHKDASPGDFKTLARIYEALEYDLGVLMAEVARKMREKGSGPPQGWMSLDNRIHSKVFPVGELKIGFIIFPPRPGKEAGFSRIAELARKMGSNLSLLIGLSPWGISKERKFLQKMPEAVDILLGSGSGPSFKEKYMDSGNTLWVRPYPEGKALHRIRLTNLRSQEKRQDPWKPRDNCHLQLVLMKESIPEKPSIKEIIH